MQMYNAFNYNTKVYQRIKTQIVNTTTVAHVLSIAHIQLGTPNQVTEKEDAKLDQIINVTHIISVILPPNMMPTVVTKHRYLMNVPSTQKNTSCTLVCSTLSALLLVDETAG